MGIFMVYGQNNKTFFCFWTTLGLGLNWLTKMFEMKI